MKKFLLYTVLLLCPLTGLFAQVTTGFHRVSKVLARAPQTVTAQVVPYASVSMSTTSTGVAATIYSDPGLTVQIVPPLVTADASGNYSYYLPLNYFVNETISSPGQGVQVIYNVGQNGGGGSSGVSQIIAGTGINVSPAGGTGAVTVTATGGSTFDPASPGDIGTTTPAKVYSTDSITKTSPTIDIRAFGATCVGTSHDDQPAFQLALNALGSTGGSILFPGNGAGCYLSNPTTLTWPSHAYNWKLANTIQGRLFVGTTYAPPDYVDHFGGGGANGTQFSSGKIGAIVGPSVTGTLGTGVSTGSQTFSPSTMTGIYPNTVLTVVESISCSFTAISRASNSVTATMSGNCHIAPGYYVTVVGVSDTSFNGTFTVNKSDYVLNTLRWKQTAANATSTSGTLSGIGEDTIENVIVTGTTLSTATASFVHSHTSAAQWGITAVQITGMGEHVLEDLTVSATGTAIWQYSSSNVHLNRVSVGSSAGPTAQALEINESFTNYYRDVIAQNFGGTSSWGVRVTNTNTSTGNPAGNLYFDGGSISGGMKLDRTSGYPAGAIFLRNMIVEQPTRGIFAVDLSTGNHGLGILSAENILLQDNSLDYEDCAITSLYPTVSGTVKLTSSATDQINGTHTQGCVSNPYYSGAIEFDTPTATPVLWPNSGHGITTSNGRITETELRGIAADLHPSLIPYATVPVSASSGWSSNAACTVAQGTLSPDGQTGAITLTATSTGGSINPYNYTFTPAVGDWILVGGWIFPHGSIASGGGYAGLSLIGADTAGSAYTVDQGSGAGPYIGTQSFEMPIYGDWWHPVAGAAKVVSADGAAHPLRLQIQCSANGTVDSWGHWMMVIPASAGFSDLEVARIRQQLLHGYVPSGAAANTLATTPALKLSLAPVQSITTTGSSGPSTLSGGVLNIPQYGSNIVASIPSTPYSSAATIGGGTNIVYTTPNDGIIHSYMFCGSQTVTVVNGATGAFQLYNYAILDGVTRAFSTGPPVLTVTNTANYANYCMPFEADPNTGVRMANFSTVAGGPPTIRYSWYIQLVR